MKFYLLARLTDDSLVLLSDGGFADRASALEALAAIAAEPGFAFRDAELLLFDIAQATPILMMPQVTAAAAVELESFADEELEGVLEEVDLEDDAIIDQLVEAVAAELPDAEVEPVEPIADVEPVSEAAPSVADEETELLAEELVIEEAIAAQIVRDAMDEEAAPAPVEELDGGPSEREAAASPSDELRAALARTASSMAAEGVVAPESVPPRAEWPWEPQPVEGAENAVEPVLEEPEIISQSLEPDAVFTEESVVELADVELPALVEEPVEPHPTELAPPATHVEPQATEFEPPAMEVAEPAADIEAPAEPVIAVPVTPVDDDLVDELLADLGAPSADDVPAADAQPEPDLPVAETTTDDLPDVMPAKAHAFDPFEEPAVDATPLVHPVAGAEETEDLSDFILGIGAPDQAEASDADQPVAAPEPPADAPVAWAPTPPMPEQAVESLGAMADTQAPAPYADAAPAFAAEVDADQLPVAPSFPVNGVPAAPTADEAPAVDEASASFGSDLTTLTCDDCVYVATCPNKEQLDPTSCGSFQWKTL